MWFLKTIFQHQRFPKFTDFTAYNSIESETDIRKPLFLGRLLTKHKMTFVVKSLFHLRPTNYFDPNIRSIGVYEVFVTPCVNTICLLTLKLGFTTSSFLVTRNGSQLFTVKCKTAK